MIANAFSAVSLQQPLDMVGSSTFGRNPKILASRTFNMMRSDDWLIGYSGYKYLLSTQSEGKGRGIFTSIKSNSLIMVTGDRVFSIKVYSETLTGIKTYKSSYVGQIETNSGDVYMDENNTNQIAICDQKNLYIYNHVLNTFTTALLPLGVVPGYVTYQNGRFIITDILSAQWFLSQVGDGLNWFWGASGEPVGNSIQTKPDFAEAVLRFPGRGNLLFVMGNSVTELWTDVGGAIFPYQRSTSLNFDYGCINASTIAILGDIVVWLGLNEKSGPVIMYSSGSDIKQISTDGINYKFQNLKFPNRCAGFLVKLSGHLIYQLTFYDPEDNYSLIYDFNTNQFFDVTDENMNFHIARRVAFFDDDYFFVSFNDNNLYKMDVDNTIYDYGLFENGSPKIYEIPRIRVCSNFRLPNSSRFVVNNINFTIQQGNDPNHYEETPSYQPRIGLSISKDGGISYGGYVTRPIYRTGHRVNRINWWGLGSCNDFVPQFRFWGRGPWNCFDGVMAINT
jgi:hypothetical protein